ncbi:MAG: hypothetical protein ACREFK_10350, partial [Stellaceae bacterium]
MNLSIHNHLLYPQPAQGWTDRGREHGAAAQPSARRRSALLATADAGFARRRSCGPIDNPHIRVVNCVIPAPTWRKTSSSRVLMNADETEGRGAPLAVGEPRP